MTDQTTPARIHGQEGGDSERSLAARGNGHDRSAPVAGTGGVEADVLDSDREALPSESKGAEPVDSLDGFAEFANAQSIEPAPRFSLRTRGGQRALARFLARELSYTERRRFAARLTR